MLAGNVKNISYSVKRNIVFLNENLCDLPVVLMHLYQSDIISTSEKQIIESFPADLDKNNKLHEVLLKKGDEHLLEYLTILSETGNDRLVRKLEESSAEASSNPEMYNPIHCEISGNWWPEKKDMLKSFTKRKIGTVYLVEELKKKLIEDENRTVVITQTPDALKLSGLGGVGKTAMAIWYANEYQSDYGAIIWIDCGEDSLFNSFKKLAAKLEVEQIENMDLSQMAKECFKIMRHLNTLWIYDNAESYLGNKGIKKVLPRNMQNFHTLITSRDVEWGHEHGHGKLPEFQMDVFSEEESISFLKDHLQQRLFPEQGHVLKELVQLLGNLPLALQLAVACLNNGKLCLEEYIANSSAIDLSDILDEEFDDYERTINKNIQISLSLIRQEPIGDIACKILFVFGYVRPNNVETEFLKLAAKVDKKDLTPALKLLEKYKLINKKSQKTAKKTTTLKTTKNLSWFRSWVSTESEPVEDIKEEASFVSIHRLLQQVIRHNGKSKEKEILRDILDCPGNVDYKLIPFTYADDELQKEFPKLKAELLYGSTLKTMFQEERFQEAVEMSHFIYNELKTNSSHYNYAVCLTKAGRSAEAMDIFNCLINSIGTMNHNRIISVFGLHLIKPGSEPDRVAIYCQIFLIYYQNGDLANSCDALQKAWGFQVNHSWDVNPSFFINLVDKTCKECAYFLQVQGWNNPIFELSLNRTFKGIYLKDCYIDCDAFSDDLQELTLKDVWGFWKKAIPTLVVSTSLKSLNVSYARKSWSLGIPILLNLDEAYSLESLTLYQCLLRLPATKITPKELNLDRVIFYNMPRWSKVSSLVINTFVDFRYLETLKLSNLEQMAFSLDGSKSVALLKLSEIKIENWEKCKWNVEKFVLNKIPYNVKNGMKMKELIITSASVDLNCLPLTLERLSCLHETGAGFMYFMSQISCDKPISFPNLKYVELQGKYISSLHLFKDSPNLTEILLKADKEIKLDANFIPPNVKIMNVFNISVEKDTLPEGLLIVKHLE